MELWTRTAMIAIGGALGSCARYGLGVWISQRAGSQFPWATFTINVSGSFAIGFLATALTRWLPHPHLRLLVVVGFLGGYTTFSTFANESFTLWERGESARSIAYMGGSVIAGFMAVVLGVALARAMTHAADGHAPRSAPAGLTPPAPTSAEPHREPAEGDRIGTAP